MDVDDAEKEGKPLSRKAQKKIKEDKLERISKKRHRKNRNAITFAKKPTGATRKSTRR